MDEPHSFLDCLNAKLLEPLKMVVHGFELFGGMVHTEPIGRSVMFFVSPPLNYK